MQMREKMGNILDSLTAYLESIPAILMIQSKAVAASSCAGSHLGSSYK